MESGLSVHKLKKRPADLPGSLKDVIEVHARHSLQYPVVVRGWEARERCSLQPSLLGSCSFYISSRVWKDHYFRGQLLWVGRCRLLGWLFLQWEASPVGLSSTWQTLLFSCASCSSFAGRDPGHCANTPAACLQLLSQPSKLKYLLTGVAIVLW